MIKNAESANVKFTSEQERQLAEWKHRLSVLHAEVRNAETQLKGYKADTIAATKEREYQTELLGRIQSEVKNFADRKESLTDEVDRLIKLKQQYEKDRQESEIRLSNKESVLSAREKVLVASEAENARRSEILTERTNILESEKKILEDAWRGLKKAVDDIRWK